MSTDTTDTTTGQPDTDEDEVDTTTDTTTDTDEKDGEPDTVARTELDKAVARRDKAIKAARDLKAELDKLKNPDAKDAEPDPVAKANRKIVHFAAKSVLAGAGISDKDDAATVLEVLNLSGVEVDDDGEVDTDALETTVENLRRIFGGAAPEKKKAPPKLNTRDRGGSVNTPADPDSSRYQQFLGHSKV